MAKLNNYYYVKGGLGLSKDKLLNKQSHRPSHKSRSSQKRACLTSKHSVHRTPLQFTSNDISPKKSKRNSKNSKAGSKRSKIVSKRPSNEQTFTEKDRVIVVNEYFKTEYGKEKSSTQTSKHTRKSSSKENKDYTSFGKIKQVVSPRNSPSWKASNLTNR
jgi:hypothetical protein